MWLYYITYMRVCSDLGALRCRTVSASTTCSPSPPTNTIILIDWFCNNATHDSLTQSHKSIGLKAEQESLNQTKRHWVQPTANHFLRPLQPFFIKLHFWIGPMGQLALLPYPLCLSPTPPHFLFSPFPRYHSMNLIS